MEAREQRIAASTVHVKDAMVIRAETGRNIDLDPGMVGLEMSDGEWRNVFESERAPIEEIHTVREDISSAGFLSVFASARQQETCRCRANSWRRGRQSE